MTNPKRIKYCCEFSPKDYHILKAEALEYGHNTLASYIRAIIATRKLRDVKK